MIRILTFPKKKAKFVSASKRDALIGKFVVLAGIAASAFSTAG